MSLSILKTHFFFWEAAHELLHYGGLLALAVPSLFGPSFYFNKKRWILEHPTDHFIDYSPTSLKKIGKAYSFQLLDIYAEGIHPERFPLGKIPILKGVYRAFQRSTAFADTIFVIFRRS